MKSCGGYSEFGHLVQSVTELDIAELSRLKTAVLSYLADGSSESERAICGLGEASQKRSGHVFSLNLSVTSPS